MAKIEVEESDLLNLQHIGTVVDQVMKSPETRQQFLGLAKKANPRLAIPEVDAAQPVIAAMNGVNKKLDDFIAAQAEKERLANEATSVNALRGAWAQDEADLARKGWRPAGIDGVKKFAEENGISNLAIAALAFERLNPQPEPAQSRASWNRFSEVETEDTYVKDQMAAMGESDSRLDQEIRATLQEVRSGY